MLSAARGNRLQCGADETSQIAVAIDLANAGAFDVPGKQNPRSFVYIAVREFVLGLMADHLKRRSLWTESRQRLETPLQQLLAMGRCTVTIPGSRNISDRVVRLELTPHLVAQGLQHKIDRIADFDRDAAKEMAVQLVGAENVLSADGDPLGRALSLSSVDVRTRLRFDGTQSRLIEMGILQMERGGAPSEISLSKVCELFHLIKSMFPILDDTEKKLVLSSLDELPAFEGSVLNWVLLNGSENKADLLSILLGLGLKSIDPRLVNEVIAQSHRDADVLRLLGPLCPAGSVPAQDVPVQPRIVQRRPVPNLNNAGPARNVNDDGGPAAALQGVPASDPESSDYSSDDPDSGNEFGDEVPERNVNDDGLPVPRL